MFPTFMITFREGLEAFLIVAISATYLIQTGRRPLLRAVRWAVITAVLLSVALGIVLARVGGMTPRWEGVLALLAAALVISCTVHMLRHGRRMKKEITNHLQSVAEDTTLAAAVAIYAFVLLMVGREGVETATMLAALIAEGDTAHMVAGGMLGVLAAATMAWAWSRYGHRVNLSRFFRVTAIFMVLFSVQLTIYAFHEFSEAQALPFLDNQYWHNLSEPYGPEGRYGEWLSYSLAFVPGIYLLFAWLRDRMTLQASPPRLPSDHRAAA